MLVVMILGAITIFARALNSSTLQTQRDQATVAALAQAKDALIGYAVSVKIINPSAASPRPGNLPCPDTNNDGNAEPSCSGNAFGRLPWKTLGLPDLRDSSGERLWYAVSSNFKKAPATSCTAAGQPGCLNSDTKGTISVFGSDGSLLHDGGGNTGAVAVIMAPGDVLKRQDGTQQDRNSAGVNNPINYLEIATIGGNTVDNANFIDGSSTNGFIEGRIKDSNGGLIVNDQLLVVTQDNIMQAIQKRVAAEARQCLNDYAASGIGLYPWAAPANTYPSFTDVSGTLLGRIPDTPFTATEATNGGMNDQWGSCNIVSNSGWWLNWKEMVFYGLSDVYSPAQNVGASKLTVNPPSATADKKFVVIVAGRTLPGQSRISNADKGTLSNYLESPNSAGASSFAQGAPSTTFNDTLVFQ